MSRTQALLVVGREFDLFFPEDLATELRSVLDVADYNGRCHGEDEYIAALEATGARIVITGWGSPQLTLRVLEASPGLEYMCHVTGGVRHAITREALASGIVVTNWGTLIGETVAEAALMSMLTCLRKTVRVSKLMHIDKGWNRRSPFEVESLFRQTVGLHGFGNIARTLVRLIEPFQCNISAFDPFLDDEVFAEYGVSRVGSLEELYSNNRIVSIHAPKIDATYHTVDAKILSLMPDGAILVNTARGNVIDTEALIRELRTGRLQASLDVYEEEPLAADSPLRGLDNCHLTPHTAGPTRDRYPDFGRLAIDNIKRYLSGEKLTQLVDVRMYDLMT